MVHGVLEGIRREEGVGPVVHEGGFHHGGVGVGVEVGVVEGHPGSVEGGVQCHCPVEKRVVREFVNSFIVFISIFKSKKYYFDPNVY